MKETNKQEVTLGNLYLYEFSDKRKIEPLYQPLPEEKLYSKIPYDSKTGNAHIIPSDINLAVLSANVICEKRTKINNYIKELAKSEAYRHIISPDKKPPSPGIILNKTPYVEAKHLFSYLGVTVKNRRYDLVFNRFFFDGNNQVNCILLCFQIEMYDINCGEKSNKRSEPPKTKNYPQTPQDGEGNEAYYNFEVNIHSSEQEIAKAFLKFICDKEKEG